MLTQDAERREYYRIEDRVAVQITPLTAEQIAAQQSPHEDSTLFNLLGDLGLLDYEAQHLLRQIDDQDRTLAAFLRALTKRVDLIAEAMAQQLCREFGSLQTVTLSEGGISFAHGQALERDSVLAIRLLLMPQALGLSLKGRVVHCRPLDNGQHEIGARFEALTDAQRQLLARHILQKQALARRQAREFTDQP